MKKNKAAVSLCIFGGVLLCGCAEVPESFNNSENTNISIIGSGATYNDYSHNAESTDSNTGTVTEISERGNIDVIRGQLEADLSRTYDNIKIENARVGDGSIMPAYDIKIGGNPDFDFKKVIEYLYEDKFDINNESYYTKSLKGEPMDPSYPATSEPTYTENGIRNPNANDYDIDEFSPVKNTDYTLSTYAYSTGAVWGSESGGGMDNEFYTFEGRKIIKRYDLKYVRPSAGTAYKMTDGSKWDAEEAIKFTENFWNTYLSASDPVKYEYSVKTLFVVKLGEDEDTYGYLFELERKDKNGNYFDVDSGYIQDNEAIESGNPFKVGNTQMTWSIEKEVITRFTKNYSFNAEKQTDDGNNLITLGKAADILSESLAPDTDLTVNSAELNYVVVCKKYPFFETWEYPWYYESICLTRCDFEIKPYWCFRTNKSTLIDPNNCEIYFIDASTGELNVMKH